MESVERAESESRCPEAAGKGKRSGALAARSSAGLTAGRLRDAWLQLEEARQLCEQMESQLGQLRQMGGCGSRECQASRTGPGGLAPAKPGVGRPAKHACGVPACPAGCRRLDWAVSSTLIFDSVLFQDCTQDGKASRLYAEGT